MRIATFTLSGNAHDRRKQFRQQRREHLVSNPGAKVKRMGVSRVDVLVVVPGRKKKTI